MKVPIAVAAVRADTAASDSDISAAITLSDNDAARRLWESLDGALSPAATVEAVLTDTGDRTPLVELLDRQGDDAFGNLDWSLADQVQFTARFPCLPGGSRVVAAMSNLTEDHRWGLATVGAAKGGWGPDADGNYLVRQIGIVDTPTGRTAITVAAQPNSGELEDGTALVTALTEWVSAHSAELPAGRCADVTR